MSIRNNAEHVARIRNNAEHVASRLIMDGITPSFPQFAQKMAEVWRQLYPELPVPEVSLFLSELWSSTREVLEAGSLHRASYYKQKDFVSERLIQYHMCRLLPHVRMDELRIAAQNDLQKTGLGSFIREMTFQPYTSQHDPERPNPSRTRYSPAEQELLGEIHQWMLQQYALKPAVPPARGSASHQSGRPAAPVRREPMPPQPVKPAAPTVKASEAPQPVQSAVTPVTPIVKAPETPQPVKPAVSPAAPETPQPAAPTVHAEPAPAPAPSESGRYEGRSRRSGSSRTPRDLEVRTLARIKGQLAIDLLLMNSEISYENDTEDDPDAVGLPQFITACQACIELPEEYRCEASLSAMWDAISSQDKALFAIGSITGMIDYRFSVLTCRCLLQAIARADDKLAADPAAICCKAFELWEAFGLDPSADAIRSLLQKNLRRNYLVNGRIPEAALALIRSRADDIRDAYSMYLEQVREEQQQRMAELNARLNEQRRLDQLQLQLSQRDTIFTMIKKFTTLENGAVLNWLCMAVHGENYSSEKLRFHIESLMQRLETIGLSPIGVDKVALVFDGGSSGTELFVDMQGHPLESGVQYRMAQLGWTYCGETVVYPLAERV